MGACPVLVPRYHVRAMSPGLRKKAVCMEPAADEVDLGAMRDIGIASVRDIAHSRLLVISHRLLSGKQLAQIAGQGPLDGGAGLDGY